MRLNVNGLNTPIKRLRIDEWVRKYDPYRNCLQEILLRTKDSHKMKLKEWVKKFHTK